jgi:thiosulfate reductase/polysulfide reductase chain A
VDLEESRLIVLIGSHIGENVFTSQVTAFSTALERGAKLVVVDPRLSVESSKAD